MLSWAWWCGGPRTEAGLVLPVSKSTSSEWTHLVKMENLQKERGYPSKLNPLHTRPLNKRLEFCLLFQWEILSLLFHKLHPASLRPCIFVRQWFALGWLSEWFHSPAQLHSKMNSSYQDYNILWEDMCHCYNAVGIGWGEEVWIQINGATDKKLNNCRNEAGVDNVGWDLSITQDSTDSVNYWN